jgi:hypothetical protein
VSPEAGAPGGHLAPPATWPRDAALTWPLPYLCGTFSFVDAIVTALKRQLANSRLGRCFRGVHRSWASYAATRLLDVYYLHQWCRLYNGGE